MLRERRRLGEDTTAVAGKRIDDVMDQVDSVLADLKKGFDEVQVSHDQLRQSRNDLRRVIEGES